MVSDYVQVDGAKLYYEVDGKGHPLVLIHAGFLDSRMWDKEFELYNENYRVIRYDVRGFGKSSHPTDKFSDSNDLYNLLKHLDVAKTYLLGVSNGGRISLDFAVEHPDMVDGMILVGTGIRGYKVAGPEEEKMWDEFDAMMKPTEDAQKKAVEENRLEDAVRIDVDLWAPAAGESRQRVLDIAMDNAHAQKEPPWKLQTSPQPYAFERLSTIKAPALLIVGDRDLWGSQIITRRLHSLLPGSKMVVLQGADHIANVSKPEEFDRTVLGFLEATATTPLVST